ncbi:uncharacterized protein DS421_15g506230 [Arachis hypogaea]|uniref:Uncharacterized protein n=1 Tax=Arachis hypogaea TaxID=3818 RepID=A0A444Z3L9_ARAHY|nr:uncharacterized protein DS421_15g506230 [Arachis hypogaea]RYR08797.1 hypothetical protein Ahy_B05g076626 [Arachis hypogaea]
MFGYDAGLSGLSRPKIQEAFEEPGEVVPDLIEKEDVVSSDGSDEATSAGQNCSMLSYNLNKTPDENDILTVECLLERRMHCTWLIGQHGT